MAAIYQRYESILRPVILDVLHDESESGDVSLDVSIEVWARQPRRRERGGHYVGMQTSGRYAGSMIPPTLKPAPSNEPNDLRPNTNHEDSEPNDPEPIWLAEEEGDYSDRGSKHIYDHSIASGHRSKHKLVQVAAGAFRQ